MCVKYVIFLGVVVATRTVPVSDAPDASSSSPSSVRDRDFALGNFDPVDYEDAGNRRESNDAIVLDHVYTALRAKRDSLDHECVNGHVAPKECYCRKLSMVVDILQMAIDLKIVGPTVYDAFFCYGRCSHDQIDFSKATNHAIIQSIVHKSNASEAYNTKCVPTVLGPLSAVVETDDHLELVDYPDMRVIECGCR